MKRALQLIQWQDRQAGKPGATLRAEVPRSTSRTCPRWTPRSPDATVIFHAPRPGGRDPVHRPMLGYAERVGRTRVDADRLIAYWAERIERLLRRGVEDRERIPANRSHDVLFHAFMKDTEGTLDTIYRRARIPRTSASRAEQAAFLEAHPRGKDGRLEYDLERGFGVRPEDLRRRFAFYFERFPVRVEES
ncbi:MAG: sulfotransferase [Sandaracinaceae bacterium]|nr:sulfotransferase [Sandaracinaceae bacterium]